MSKCDDLSAVATWLRRQDQANLAATVVRAIEEITRLRAELDALRAEVKRLTQAKVFECDCPGCPSCAPHICRNRAWRCNACTLAPFVAVARAAAEFEKAWIDKVNRGLLILKVIALGDTLTHPLVAAKMKEARDA